MILLESALRYVEMTSKQANCLNKPQVLFFI